MKTAYFLLCFVAIAIFSVTGSPVDDGRIVNGMQINIQNAPYMVRLVHDSGIYCGGSLVDPNYVVTAAHCVYGKDVSKVTIIANVTTIYETGIRRKVSRWFVHPDYNPKNMHSDVAVLRLNAPITSMRSLPLCADRLKEHDTIQVSGWGRMAENKSGTTSLNTVFLPVRSQALCRQQYHRFVAKDMFCASGLENRAACRGDSGGPAVFKGQLCGIVAFSYTCGVVGSSEVYTDVLQMKPFIQRCMQQ